MHDLVWLETEFVEKHADESVNIFLDKSVHLHYTFVVSPCTGISSVSGEPIWPKTTVI